MSELHLGKIEQLSKDQPNIKDKLKKLKVIEKRGAGMSEAERWVDDNIPNALYMKKFIVRGYNAGYHARDAEIQQLRAENADMKEVCKDRAQYIIRCMDLEAGIRELRGYAERIGDGLLARRCDDLLKGGGGLEKG